MGLWTLLQFPSLYPTDITLHLIAVYLSLPYSPYSGPYCNLSFLTLQSILWTILQFTFPYPTVHTLDHIAVYLSLPYSPYSGPYCSLPFFTIAVYLSLPYSPYSGPYCNLPFFTLKSILWTILQFTFLYPTVHTLDHIAVYLSYPTVHTLDHFAIYLSLPYSSYSGPYCSLPFFTLQLVL